jgi:hypothetical protein
MATYSTTANQIVWNGWINVTPLTTTYASNTATWDRWLTTGTTAATIGYDRVYTWEQWEDAGQPYVWREYYQQPAVREPTQEELDAAQRRREDQSARLLAEKQRLAGAEDRAMELFRSLLTADQRQTMDQDGEVWVKGSDGGFYVVETRDGRVHGNVRSVDEHGCMLGRLCVQPGMYDHQEGAALPTSDGYVGQLLAIRFNEREFRATANWSGRRACQQPDVPILRAA